MERRVEDQDAGSGCRVMREECCAADVREGL